MGIFYRAGETKIRPGVYQRYSSAGAPVVTNAVDGIAAIAIQANWGPLGEVTTHTREASILATYGNDAYAANTTARAAVEMLHGGALTVHIVRLGIGGKKASKELGSVATIEAKYPGTKPLSYSIATDLTDAAKKILTVYDGTTEVETFKFAIDGENDVKNLAKTVTEGNSAYINVVVTTETGTVPEVNVTEGALEGGENPTITNESYSQAWATLEQFDYNVIALDKTDDGSRTLSLLLQAYVQSAYATGKLCVAVVGEPTSVNFATRVKNAASYNDEKIVYVGTGFMVGTTKYDGALAICRVAGLIAGTPANESIVHKEIPGATDVIERLTNVQYEQAIENGMLLFSVSHNGTVWCDSGINTLVSPADTQDAGWKKIRRVKTRFEVMTRIDRAVAPKIGRVNCDDDGIADIIQTAQAILNAMVAENKLYDGATIYEDPDNARTADSSWFVIEAVDRDSLEKIYLHYNFRYSNV